MELVQFAGPQPAAQDPNVRAIHNAATITTNGSQVVEPIFGTSQVVLIINITGTPTGNTPTLQFSVQEIDPVNQTTPVSGTTTSNSFVAAGYQVITLDATKSGAFKVSWTVGGTTPSFTGVNVSLSSKSGGGATEATLAGVLTTTAFQARINTFGQKTMAASTPVVLASDQGAIPVTGSFGGSSTPSDAFANPTTAQLSQGFLMGWNGTTWDRLKSTTANGLVVDVSRVQGNVAITAAALPLPTGAATEATLGGVLTTTAFQARIGTLGQKTMVGSTPVVLASDQSSIPVSGTFWQATQPVSAASLPLPTGAATETTLGTRLAEATFTTRVPVQGQALMAASVPVVLASNQSAVSVSGTFWQATQPVSAASLPLPTGAATETTLGGVLTTTAFQARINTFGQKTMAASTPVVLASDQGAIPVTGSFGGSSTPSDAFANPTTAQLSQGFLMGWNGTTWDRLKSTTANGLVVDVSRVQGNVAITAAALPLPTGAATAAKQPALGTAGTPSADVITVQGATSMTALKVDGSGATQPVSGTITANQGTAAALSGAWPAKITDGTNQMPTGDAAARALYHLLTDGTNTAAVKAASTAPLATDPAVVVAISPNSSLTATNPSVGTNGATAPTSSTQIAGKSPATGNLTPVTVGPDGHLGITGTAMQGYAGEIVSWHTDDHQSPGVDASGALYMRGQIMTDEGSFVDDFLGSSLSTALTGTLSFTNGSDQVVGTGTAFLSELNYYSVIKKTGDAETLWVGVSSVEDDTHLTLAANYAGTTQSGQTAVKSIWKTLTGASGGAAIAVASSILTLTSGTASGVRTGIWTIKDYIPFLGTLKLAMTARIANQSIFAGYFDDITSPQVSAGFLFDGATNTTVKCVSSTTSAVADTQTTSVTIPGGVATTAQATYQVVPWQGQVSFLINGYQVAVHNQHVIPPYTDVGFGAYIVNAAVVASTNVTIDGVIEESIDRLDARVYSPVADHMQVMANGRTTTGLAVPLQVSTAGIQVVSASGNFTVVQGTAASLKAQVVGLATTADAFANSTTAVTSQDLLQGFNGTTWDRLRCGANNADAEAVKTLGVLDIKAEQYLFNGTTWDRARGTITNGMLVDVSRVTGNVAITAAALPLPTGAATETTLGTRLAEATFTTRVPVLGQAAMAASSPVVIASNQSAVPVSGTFWQATQPVSGTVTGNQGTANTAANGWPVKITDGTNQMPTGDAAARGIYNRITDGTSQAAVKAASTAAVAADPALVVAISPNNTVPSKEPRPGTSTQSNVAISATSVTVLASNANRLKFSVRNDTAQLLYLSFNGAASLTNHKLVLEAGEYYEDPYPSFTGTVTGLWASTTGGGAARVEEQV